ncbi:MAG: DUF2851 family protein, partial [Verrucomicrobiales bacterium]
KLVQQIWLYQRILRDKLHTTSGEAVRVIHPGFWNHEAGPDFKKAIVQIGNRAPVEGDIEIDLLPQGWQNHAHAGNPNYKNVILHMVWTASNPSGSLPMLEISRFIDSPLSELAAWLSAEPLPFPFSMAGHCSSPMKHLDLGLAEAVLRQAGEARLTRKAELLQARARQAGWRQTLWEGLFGALGYKGNVWPMRRIAEMLPLLLADLPLNSESQDLVEARLLGVSGLLPNDIPPGIRNEGKLSATWHLWWHDRDRFADHILPGAAWKLNGVRPANRPERRLALAATWLVGEDLPVRLDQWITREIHSSDLVSSLLQILLPSMDLFWSYHCTLASKKLSKPQPLLGDQRLTDIAMNVVLPWLWVRALAGKNNALKEAAEKRYFAWPRGEDNSVLKLARQRLFASESVPFIKSAAAQQGLLQIVRDFCEHSNSACEGCPFPDLLRGLSL